MRRAWFALVSAGLCGGAAVTACAQSPLSAEVSWSLAHVAGGDLGGRSKTSDDARLQIGFPVAANTQVVFGGAFERYNGYHVVVIAPVQIVGPGAPPPAVIRPPAPNVDYTAFVFGLRHRASQLVDLGVGAGIGTVHVTGTYPGWGRGVSAEADATLQLSGPLHALLRAELLRFNAGGNVLTLPSLSIGLRIN